MALYKVEICGVNTAKLPLLSSEEKEVLFKKNKAGRPCGERGIHPGKSAAGA